VANSAVVAELSVPRHRVIHSNGCVKFEFNDKSWHTKNDSELRRSVGLINKFILSYIAIVAISCNIRNMA